MSWYLAALGKYATFTGRARRKEFWWFTLMSLLVIVALTVAQGMTTGVPDDGDSIVANLYQLAVLLPTIAVGVRRMHDSDKSGWWVIVPVANLFLWCVEGSPMDNRFGPSPKATDISGVPSRAD